MNARIAVRRSMRPAPARVPSPPRITTSVPRSGSTARSAPSPGAGQRWKSGNAPGGDTLQIEAGEVPGRDDDLAPAAQLQPASLGVDRDLVAVRRRATTHLDLDHLVVGRRAARGAAPRSSGGAAKAVDAARGIGGQVERRRQGRGAARCASGCGSPTAALSGSWRSRRSSGTGLRSSPGGRPVGTQPLSRPDRIDHEVVADAEAVVGRAVGEVGRAAPRVDRAESDLLVPVRVRRRSGPCAGRRR